MPPKMTFTAWKRSKLFASAQMLPGQPRLGATLTLTLSDDAGGVPIAGDAPFTLLAATDVAGLKPGAILRTAPPALARDAETTKLVHVDFAEPDLPWRYTPQRNAPNVRPWLALLVGTADELQVEAGVIKRVSPDVLKAHPLAESHTWAHAQDNSHSRLVSTAAADAAARIHCCAGPGVRRKRRGRLGRQRHQRRAARAPQLALLDRRGGRL